MHKVGVVVPVIVLPVFHVADCKFLDASLKLHSSSNRFDRAWKLGQATIRGH
jgi:hypothetical protein